MDIYKRKMKLSWVFSPTPHSKGVSTVNTSCVLGFCVLVSLPVEEGESSGCAVLLVSAVNVSHIQP